MPRKIEQFTIGEETKPLTEWCRQYDKPVTLVRSRLQGGWPLEEALTTPRLYTRIRGRWAHVKRFPEMD